MEGVHQIAVRILTLTEIFSPIFHTNFDIFSDNLEINIHQPYIHHHKQKKHTKRYAFDVHQPEILLTSKLTHDLPTVVNALKLQLLIAITICTTVIAWCFFSLIARKL